MIFEFQNKKFKSDEELTVDLTLIVDFSKMCCHLNNYFQFPFVKEKLKFKIISCSNVVSLYTFIIFPSF